MLSVSLGPQLMPILWPCNEPDSKGLYSSFFKTCMDFHLSMQVDTDMI